MVNCYVCKKNLFKCRKIPHKTICDCKNELDICKLLCIKCHDEIWDIFENNFKISNKNDIITDNYEASGRYLCVNGKIRFNGFYLIIKKSCIYCETKCLLDDYSNLINKNKDKNKFYNDDMELITNYYFKIFVNEKITMINKYNEIREIREIINNDETLKMIIEYNNFLSQNNELKSI